MKRLLAIFLTGCLILGPSVGALAEGENDSQTSAAVQEEVAGTEGEPTAEPEGEQTVEGDETTAGAQIGERNAALAAADGSGAGTDDGEGKKEGAPEDDKKEGTPEDDKKEGAPEDDKKEGDPEDDKKEDTPEEEPGRAISRTGEIEHVENPKMEKTSEGIKPVKFEIDESDPWSPKIIATVEITKEVNNDELVINMNDMFDDLDLITIPDGDAEFVIKLVDNSGKNYKFVDGSAKIGLVPTVKEGNGGEGFDGNPIISGYYTSRQKFRSNCGSRIWNKPLKALFEEAEQLIREKKREDAEFDDLGALLKKGSDNVLLSDGNLDKLLWLVGYRMAGDAQSYEGCTKEYLDDWYVDWYQKNTGRNITKFDELSWEELFQAVPSTGNFISCEETNIAIQEMQYYYFYKHGYDIVLGSGDGKVRTSLYDIMKQQETETTELEKRIKEAWEKEADESGVKEFAYTVFCDGRTVWNTYQNFDIAPICLQFKLALPKPEPTPIPDPIPDPTPIPTPIPTPTPTPTPEPTPEPEPTPIPDDPTPLDDQPDIEEEEPEDIEEDEVPLDDKPEVEEEEIPDEETPLSDNPLTGDQVPLAWAGLGLFSILGGLLIFKRRK